MQLLKNGSKSLIRPSEVKCEKDFSRISQYNYLLNIFLIVVAINFEVTVLLKCLISFDEGALARVKGPSCPPPVGGPGHIFPKGRVWSPSRVVNKSKKEACTQNAIEV